MPATITIPTSLQKARRTAASAWLERTNPLAGLSVRAAQRIYDAARGGDYSRIQYIYSEIEREDPVLMTCVDRRASAVAGLGWRVSTLRDGAEAGEQKRALEERLAQAEGLDAALEHLALAFFRGFSHARPVWDAPGRLAGFDLLNGWNFARDPATGTWFWNPLAEYCDPSRPGPGLVEVPRGELVTVSRVRDIDRPALALCLRGAVGERDWGRFLERYGIPFVVFTAPPTASDETMPRFAEAAEKISDGLPTAVPAGSAVSFAGEARGSDPFTPFAEHIHKLVVLMSTGGTLTSLAESGAGTLAGNAQMDVWKEIVKRDGVAIGAAIDRGVCRPILRALFPGRAPLVKFELGGDRQLDPGEIFDIAAKARAAGYRIDKAELEKATGYTLVEEPAQGGDGAGFPDFRDAGGAPFPQKPRNGVANPLQNARKGAEVHLPPPAGETRQNANLGLSRLAEALGADMAPARDALLALLDLPEAERPAAARELMGRLDSLMPADPAMAAVLAEEMAEAFAEGAGEGAHEDTKALANAITNPCPKCHRQMAADGTCSFCAKRAANHEAGKTAFAEVEKTHKDVVGAMERDSIGKIDFIWGDDTEGIRHILGKHRADAAMIPGVIAYGDVYEDAAAGKYYVVKKKNLVVLRKGNGTNHYLVTGYKKDDPNAIARIRKENRLVEKGE